MNIDLAKTQQYLEWLKNKLYLNALAPSAKNRIVYRGQVLTSQNTLVAPITHTTSTLPVVVPIADKKILPVN